MPSTLTTSAPWKSKAASVVTFLIRALAQDSSLRNDDVWVVDSTPVERGRSRDTVKRSDLAGWARYGYRAGRSAG